MPSIAGRATCIDGNFVVDDTALNASFAVHEYAVVRQELQPYSRAFVASVIIVAVTVAVLPVFCFK